MIDLGRITQGERGTLTFTWEFPDNLTSPATVLAATITATMRNLDTGAVTAVTGTLTGTAATTATWALSAEDSGTAGAFAVTFRASVAGVTTYTLEARLAIADNPAVDTVAAPPLVGIDADDAAWVAVGSAGGALGTAAYEDIADLPFDDEGAAAAVQGNLDSHTGDTGNPHGVTAVQVGADLAGSAAAAQAFAVQRANHTGTQAASTISNFNAAAKAADLWPVTQINSDAVLALTDARAIIENTKTTATVITIPASFTVNFPIGSRIEFRTVGGPLSFVGAAGVSIQSPGGERGLSQVYAAATLTKVDTDIWWLTGVLTTGYVINDVFSTDLPAGSIDDTNAEPGPGIRSIVDVGGSNVLISGDKISITGTGSDNQSCLTYETPITRQAGLVLAYNFQIGTSLLTLYTGHLTNISNLSGFYNNTGIFVGGDFFRTRKTATINVFPISVGVEYRVAVVLRDNGKYVFVKHPDGVWRFWWIDEWDTTTTLYTGFNIRSNALTAYISDVKAPLNAYYDISALVSDSFDRDDAATLGSTDGAGHDEANSGAGLAWTPRVGTWGISSDKAVCSALSVGLGIATVASGEADVFVRVKLTVAGGVTGIVVRYVDASNYIYAYHDGTNIALVKRVAGVETTVISPAAKTYVAGAYLQLVCDGNNFYLFYNDTSVLTGTIADAALQAGENHGMYTTNTGNAFDDYLVFAHNAGYSDLDDII